MSALLYVTLYFEAFKNFFVFTGKVIGRIPKPNLPALRQHITIKPSNWRIPIPARKSKVVSG
jgi:hypothetical protein